MFIALTEAGLVAAVVNPRQVRDFAQASGGWPRPTASMPQSSPTSPRPSPRRLSPAAIPRRRDRPVRHLPPRPPEPSWSPSRTSSTISTSPPWTSAPTSASSPSRASVNELEPPSWPSSAAIARACLYTLLTAVPGVGPVLAATLIANMRELGTIGRRQAASLIGVAPFNDDSDRRHGRRPIAGGRADIRSVLYMAAVAAPAAIRPSATSTNACAPRENPPNSSSPPACENSSSSSTPKSAITCVRPPPDNTVATGKVFL